MDVCLRVTFYMLDIYGNDMASGRSNKLASLFLPLLCNLQACYVGDMGTGVRKERLPMK